MNQNRGPDPLIKKVMIVTNIPNPYRIPLFNEINYQLATKGIKLKVLFGAKGYSRRMFKIDMHECLFEYLILNGRVFKLRKNKKSLFTYAGLLREIKFQKPDVIIIIGYSWGTVKLWLRSFFKKTVYIIWSGSVIHPYRRQSILRKWQRKMLIKRASGFIAYGRKARDYLIRLGAAPEKISIAINTVDTDFFSQKTEELRKSLSKESNQKYLTYIGYLTKRKNVKRLLEVILELSKFRSDFVLDIVGDGPERGSLEGFVREKSIEKFVVFHGFKQKFELPQFLARSSCFLFQTDFDIWGLVLNEAMAAGIPCIASVNAGATHDLIREGETGFAADFSDSEKVVEKICWILDHPKEALIMGKKASDFITKNAGLNNSAKGFMDAILCEPNQ
jgi:glycosyltransferase involved in cell wall biosynthesis